MLSPAELKKLHPRKRLAAFVPRTPKELAEEDGEDVADTDGVKEGIDSSEKQRGGLNRESEGPVSLSKARSKPVSATYVWGGLTRIDIVAAPPSTALAFFSSGNMRVYSMPLLRADQNFELEDEDDGDEEDEGSRRRTSTSEVAVGGRRGAGGGSKSVATKAAEVASRGSSLVCTASVAARGGLVPHDLLVKPMMSGLGGVGVGGKSGALADIAVSGEDPTLWLESPSFAALLFYVAYRDRQVPRIQRVFHPPLAVVWPPLVALRVSLP